MEISKVTVKERNLIFDIIKALGIIAIVIGHCFPSKDVIRFVYGFHLPIFFFVSGLQFNDEKYSKSPYYLLQNRVKSMWGSCFFYMTFFTLTNNLFLKLHILPGNEFTGLNSVINKIFANFFLVGFERLGGAMWFVPMMLSGVIIFGAINYISFEFFNRFRIIIASVLGILAGALGIYCCQHSLRLTHYTQVSLLLIPIMLLGYLISYKKLALEKLLRLPIAILTLILFIYFTVIKDYHIELSVSQIVSPLLFYPIVICGIYNICYLAKAAALNKYIAKALAFIGKYSFDIMALHFLCFKVIDLIFGTITNTSPEIYSAFPHGFTHIWPIYIIVGIIAPPFIRIGASKLYSLIKGFFKRVF